MTWCTRAGSVPNSSVRHQHIVFRCGLAGNPYRCLESARAGIVEGVTCHELLNELAEKLQAKLNFSATQVTDTVANLLSFLRLVTITKTLKVIGADPDDDKVLDCAVVGGASNIVTGDRRHLQMDTARHPRQTQWSGNGHASWERKQS